MHHYNDSTAASELEDAIKACDEHKVAKLLATDKSLQALLNSKQEEKDGMLFLAIESDSSAILHTLMNYGLDINQRNINGMPALHIAIMKRKINAATTLINSGIDLCLLGPSGEHAIHHAAAQGYTNLLSALLQMGCDINTCDNNQDTPLHYAVGFSQESTINYLIANHANQHKKNLDGISAYDQLTPFSEHEFAPIKCNMWLSQSIYVDSGIGPYDLVVEINKTITPMTLEEAYCKE